MNKQGSARAVISAVMLSAVEMSKWWNYINYMKLYKSISLIGGFKRVSPSLTIFTAFLLLPPDLIQLNTGPSEVNLKLPSHLKTTNLLWRTQFLNLLTRTRENIVVFSALKAAGGRFSIFTSSINIQQLPLLTSLQRSWPDLASVVYLVLNW